MRGREEICALFLCWLLARFWILDSCNTQGLLVHQLQFDYRCKRDVSISAFPESSIQNPESAVYHIPNFSPCFIAFWYFF